MDRSFCYRRSGRGSTVDLTLFDMETEKEVDMGGTILPEITDARNGGN